MTDATLSAKVTADIADFVKKFDQVQGSIDKLGSGVTGPAEKASAAIGQVTQKIGDVGALLKSGALVAGGAALTAGVTAPMILLGREAVMMADKLRQSEIAFTVLLGSGERATSMLRDLQAFAARTPFQFPELIQSAKKMLALGFSAEQVIPTLTNVGNAVSGLGGNAGTFDRIILALGQMQAKGQVMSQEMRQLAEAGVPAWQLLADAIGTTVPEAMERVTKKQIDSATAIAALQAGMAAKFGGLMEQQATTIEGTLANLRDTVNFIMTDIGRELIETLKIREGLAAVQEFTKGFLEWFRQLDAGTKQVLLVLTGTFAVGGPILVAVGAFMAAMAVVTAPLLIGGAIVAGLAAGAMLILLNWQKVQATGLAIWEGLRTAVSAIVTRMTDVIYEQFIGRFVAIVNGVRDRVEAVKNLFKGLYDAVAGHSYVPDMVDGIEAEMQRLNGAAMVQPVAAATAKAAAQFKAFEVNTTSSVRNATAETAAILEGAAFTWSGVLSQVATTANNVWGSAAQTVGNSLAQMTQGAVNWSQVMTNLGVQVLGQFIANTIQIATQWAIAEATKTAATLSGETTRTTLVATSAGIQAGAVVTAAGTMAAANTAAAAVSTAVWSGAAAAILGFFGTIASGFTAIAVGLVTAVTAVGTWVMGVLSAIAAAMKATIFGIPVGIVIVASVVAIGAALAATGNIPALEQGGIVTRPTLALIGEAGPEAVMPLGSRYGGRGLGGGGSQTIILQVGPRELARWVAPELVKELRLKIGAVA